MRNACWRHPSPGCTAPSWPPNCRRRRASTAAGSSLGHAGQNLADPPALLLRHRPRLLDEDAIADPTLVILVVRLQLLRHPDDSLISRMPEHALDLDDPRLLHRVRDDHALTVLPLTHGCRPSSRGAPSGPAPGPSAPAPA